MPCLDAHHRRLLLLPFVRFRRHTRSIQTELAVQVSVNGSKPRGHGRVTIAIDHQRILFPASEAVFDEHSYNLANMAMHYSVVKEGVFLSIWDFQVSVNRHPSARFVESHRKGLDKLKYAGLMSFPYSNGHLSLVKPVRMQVQNHTPAQDADMQNTTTTVQFETTKSESELMTRLDGANSTSKEGELTVESNNIAVAQLSSVGDKKYSARGSSLCIIVVGATGELARHKIFPALFALHYSGCLPQDTYILGYSRTQLTNDEFRNMISDNLTCRIDHQEDCADSSKGFLSKAYYHFGGYDSCDGMSKLNAQMQELEGNGIGNRIFYLSVPQHILLKVATCMARNAQSKNGWNRVIIEKPFGYDGNSSSLLTQGLLAHLNEEQIYRIDHRLGKDLIENLTVLRFSNLVFEPLWSRTYIRNVQVVLSEDWGLEGRGRYFDKYGIIRDIVQSHILQTIALVAMEPPASLAGDDIRNEKVKVLRSMRQPTFQDVVLGQYKSSIAKDGKCRVAGYLDEPNVSPESITPTFVASVFYIDNARWDGVPFLIKAGMGMIKHRVEVRIQFRHVPGNLYRDCFGYNLNQATNELVLQIQPEGSIVLKINNKVPGLGLQLDSSELNLFYKDRYNTDVRDSYEHLIMDVIDGDNHLFIRSDELAATWNLLDPLLEEIERQNLTPELYQFGGRGPVGAYYLGAKHGVRWADD